MMIKMILMLITRMINKYNSINNNSSSSNSTTTTTVIIIIIAVLVFAEGESSYFTICSMHPKLIRTHTHAGTEQQEKSESRFYTD